MENAMKRTRLRGAIAGMLGVAAGVVVTLASTSGLESGLRSQVLLQLGVAAIALLAATWLFALFANYVGKGRPDDPIGSPTVRWLLDVRRRRGGVQAGYLFDLEGVVRRVF